MPSVRKEKGACLTGLVSGWHGPAHLWESILRVKCPGFEQGTQHLRHFWEAQASCGAMNLI